MNSYARWLPSTRPSIIRACFSRAKPSRCKCGAGEEVQADFAMRHIKTVQVSGHVVAADGKPATHAYVAMRVPDVDDFGSDLGGSTDEKGEFIIKGVSPGTYVMSAQQRVDGHPTFAHQKLDVGDSNLDNVVLSFGSGVTIAGRITAVGSGVALDRAHVFLTRWTKMPARPAGLKSSPMDRSN